MIQIRDIDHLVLRVTDLPGMLRFYCDGLGCQVERQRDDIGLTQLRAGRSMLDLVPIDGALGRAGGAPPGEAGRTLDHFCFRRGARSSLARRSSSWGFMLPPPWGWPAASTRSWGPVSGVEVMSILSGRWMPRRGVRGRSGALM